MLCTTLAHSDSATILRSKVYRLLRQSARTDQDHKPCMRWSCWSGPAGRRLSRRGMLCTTLAHSDSATILRSKLYRLLRQSARTDQDRKPCMHCSCWTGPAGRRLFRRGKFCTTLALSDSATILQNTVYKLLILMGQNALERKQANTRGIHSTDLLEHYYLLCQRYSLCTRLAPYCAGIGQRGSSDRSWDHNSHVLVNISPLHRANSFVERIGHCRSRRNN